MGLRLRSRATLAWIVVAGLVLAILPSFTALSASYQNEFPELARWSGPLNPVKFLIPFFILHLVLHFQNITVGAWKKIALFWGTGTLFTLISSARCDWNLALFREWMVMSIAGLGALCFVTLDLLQQKKIIAGWLAIVFGSVILDLFFPSTINWLYAHIFDPDTRQWDQMETGGWALTGIFGRQSMAKLLTWVPWIGLYFFAQDQAIRPRALLLPLFTLPLILATSQRGPFVAQLLAVVFLAALDLRRKFTLKRLSLGITSLLLALFFTWLLVPSRILESRLYSLTGQLQPKAEFEQAAITNKYFRLKINQISLELIRKYPLGTACPDPEIYYRASVIPGHAHNLFLEQFRTRGWVFGLMHLALWIGAIVASAKSKKRYLTAGLISICISGLFDHPWFVISQAIVLACALALSFISTFQSKIQDQETR